MVREKMKKLEKYSTSIDFDGLLKVISQINWKLFQM